MSLTVSPSSNIITPRGNELAVFIDSVTNKLSLKDIYNNTQEVFSGEATFDRLVLNPEGAITVPVPDKAILLISKASEDNSIQISVNRKISLSGDGGTGTLNYLELSEIESASVFTGSSAQIVEKQARAEFKGQGSVSTVQAYIGGVQLEGDLDKTINTMYAITATNDYNGTGNDDVTFSIGYSNVFRGANDNATIGDHFGFNSQDFSTGAITITDTYASFSSFGLTNTNLIVNEYIGYFHKSNNPTLATDNYFMKNESDMPLDTVGSIISKDYSIKALNSAPSSATDTGTTGEIRFTSDAIYVCTATNTWKKSDILTF